MVEPGGRDHLDPGVERDVGERPVGDHQRGPGNEEQPLLRSLGTARRTQRLPSVTTATPSTQRMPRAARPSARSGGESSPSATSPPEIRASRAKARNKVMSDAGRLVANEMCAPVPATSMIRTTALPGGLDRQLGIDMRLGRRRAEHLVHRGPRVVEQHRLARDRLRPAPPGAEPPTARARPHARRRAIAPALPRASAAARPVGAPLSERDAEDDSRDLLIPARRAPSTGASPR